MRSMKIRKLLMMHIIIIILIIIINISIIRIIIIHIIIVIIIIIKIFFAMKIRFKTIKLYPRIYINKISFSYKNKITFSIILRNKLIF